MKATCLKAMVFWVIVICKTWRKTIYGFRGPFGKIGHGKISNLTVTELFYSLILYMKRGPLHTRSFRRIQFSFFRYRPTKNGFTGRKRFRGFRETVPRTGGNLKRNYLTTMQPRVSVRHSSLDGLPFRSPLRRV